MARFNQALLPLCSCLRGEIPPRPDWEAIIALANQTLTTPSLMGLVRSHRPELPHDMVSYVQELHDRNTIRNDRLSVQLEETTFSLNRVGIVPLLIKGSAILASSSPSDRAMRLMSDLDLIVHPDEIDAAMKALRTIGYRVDTLSDGPQTKWYADLKRPSDVGMIDLHQAFPGYAFLSPALDDLRSHLQPIRLGTAAAVVPSPELQALVLMMHDQFQDYDYWTGSIDLRHLLDLRLLIAGDGGFRRDVLMKIASSPLSRNAMETQLLLLTRLLGVHWPAHCPIRLVPKLQVRRRLLQARFPPARYCLLPMGLLDYRSRHRTPTRLSVLGRRSRRWFPKLSTLRFLISLSRRHRAGKI